jgi:MFS family permease
MIRLLLPILALFSGSAFLMMAGGVNGLILPLRGGIEGFSAFSLGLLGTGWAIGYIAGCLRVPYLVERAGHIRAFAVMSAGATISVLASLLLIDATAWILLRALTGFCFAGAAMIVESWLGEHSDANNRGRIFGIYTMVNLFGVTLGQLSVALGDPGGPTFFALAAIFYAISLVPPSMTRTQQPRPLVESRLNLRLLVRNSPVAVVAAFLIGVSNSAFGTLGVVFGGAIGLHTAAIAVMMSTSILTGSLLQIPVGILSDRMDRRIVLIGVAVLAVIVDLYFIFGQPGSPAAVLIAAAVFGGSIYAMYPVIVAHAIDHAKPDSYLQISGGLLLLYGTGGIFGPLLAGAIMVWNPKIGLFITTLLAHLILAAFAYYRLSRRDTLQGKDKTDFVNIPPARLATPETGMLDPRIEELEEGTQ